MEDVLLQIVICEPSALPTGCWEWQGGKLRNGYGRVSYKGKRVLVHRLLYEHFVGPIPEGLEPDHLCRNRACVNFEHMEPVTHRVNVLRGDTFAARHCRKTHCPRGHEYSLENTKTYKGMRFCRACAREKQRELRRKSNGDNAAA